MQIYKLNLLNRIAIFNFSKDKISDQLMKEGF